MNQCRSVAFYFAIAKKTYVSGFGASHRSFEREQVISRGNGPAIRFEFDTDGSGLSAGNDEPIALAGFETPDDVANKIVAAINNRLSELGLRPANLGNGLV